jgi:(2R)-phospho-3-sulfolactate synthase (ComA)
MTPETMATGELAFPFLRAKEPPNARAHRVTATRGPYYLRMGPRNLSDVFDTMGEHQRITEEVANWRTDVVATIAQELGLEKVMFEAADPEVFGAYVKTTAPRSTSWSTTHRSCSSSACAAAVGAPRASGAVSSPTKARERR